MVLIGEILSYRPRRGGVKYYGKGIVLESGTSCNIYKNRDGNFVIIEHKLTNKLGVNGMEPSLYFKEGCKLYRSDKGLVVK